MIRDITLGQYYPANSILHKLDPRVKLLGTLIFMISLFISFSWYALGMATIFLFTIIKLSKVPFRFMTRGLKAIVILLLFSVLFQLFRTPGVVLIEFWVLQITVEGVTNAVFFSLRIIFLIIGSSIMTLTTTPNNLTDGLEKGLHPLNKLHIPVHDISMMMSIALRFVPILLEETDKIMKAQIARGADFEEGKIVEKIKGIIPLIVPLFISAYRRAIDLAMAMVSRCYNGGEGRTKMKPLIYKGADFLAYAILFVYLGIVIGIRVIFR